MCEGGRHERHLLRAGRGRHQQVRGAEGPHASISIIYVYMYMCDDM